MGRLGGGRPLLAARPERREHERRPSAQRHLGVNWYLYSSVLIRSNFVYSDVRDTGNELGNAKGNILAYQMRTQPVF